MENICFDENTGDFINDFTVETFFKLKIDFNLLFENLVCQSFPLISDLTKCYYVIQVRKTCSARIKFYYTI